MVQNATKQPGQGRKRLIRMITLVSMLAFLGRMGFSTVKPFIDALSQPEPAETVEADANTQLQTQERGYQIVLEREPENQTALEGLLRVRLQMNNIEGAIEPLEKLVALNPEREDYKGLLKQLKHDLEQ